MKRLAVLVALIVAGLLLSGEASIADTNIPNNEITSIVNKTASANATITITMRTPEELN